MRIFIAVRHSTDPKQFYGGLWSGNFYPALRRLGHDLIESQTELAPASRFMEVPDGFTPDQLRIRGDITQRVLDEIKLAHAARPLDLVLTYFYNSHFDPAGFDEVHRLGVPTVNFYCNSIYQFELVTGVAAKARFAWHAEKDARARYLGVGANPVWVQMGADPDVYNPVPSAVREPKAVFVGQKYADRDRWMAALVRAGVPVDIYGPGWGNSSSGPLAARGPTSRLAKVNNYLKVLGTNVRAGGPVGGMWRTVKQARYRAETVRLATLFARHAKGAIPFTEIAPTFARYEVCLNFSNVWADGRPGGGLIPHVRLRDFEGPMSRTCFLTGHTEEIEEFYCVGEEVDTYRTPDELIDKARYYLAHPGRAEALREAGYRRAVRDHTWDRRFVELFRKIGVSG